ncbi:branched-chain amino acid transporter permease [Macrococcus animalis]|uniref:branched-chain amino acid transporter permease n=1 Tax=Macrococcus animalis TaxID=3395467 RepID=UPI0039BDCE6E
MTLGQQLIIIFCVALATMITRYLPFMIFKDDKPLPEIIEYMGRVLPPAVFALLVVYALKDIKWLIPSANIPAVLAITLIIVLHAWKRNMLLSISIGTIYYMIVLRLI